MHLLIHGTYQFWPRRHAFRNDYCLSCDAPRPAEQTSSLVVLHVYWIPLIPLGRWKSWKCEACGERPYHDSKLRWSFKATLSAVLCIASISVWILPAPADATLVFGALRVALPAAAAVMVSLAVRAGEATTYRERFATVAPANDEVCPYCAVELVSEFNEFRCPSCRVRRL